MEAIMKNKTAYFAIFTSLLVIFSWISIPLPIGVPITLQTFGIFLISLIFQKDSWKILLLYLVLGAIGLPVFSNFTGGIGIILGPTGGFLIGFLAASFVMYFKRIPNIILIFLELIIIYSFGIFWFMISTANDITKAISILVPTFIWFDIAKLILAFTTFKILNRYISLTQAC
ncbi:biotin transporter BioY [Geotoga petraea]|uniref:Biotin transporter n=2 Tax=Geotoga petraea TaxID=28234 RepID=A0A4Z0VVQ7_9BACT|nr:biotin transporter BioY [Geotoga petraea]